MKQLTITLRDLNPDVCDAWRGEFIDVAAVAVTQGDILGEPADAIVSPANSFGFMDGGIDFVYSKRFGWQLQDRLQGIIRRRFDGELPVGTAVIVETGDVEFPLLISAPTMRVPEDVAHTANAYLAFRAALQAVTRHNASSEEHICSIVCPGLATAIGGMAPTVCAKQMRRAYDRWRNENGWSPASIMAARRDHDRLVDPDRRI